MTSLAQGPLLVLLAWAVSMVASEGHLAPLREVAVPTMSMTSRPTCKWSLITSHPARSRCRLLSRRRLQGSRKQSRRIPLAPGVGDVLMARGLAAISTCSTIQVLPARTACSRPGRSKNTALIPNLTNKYSPTAHMRSLEPRRAFHRSRGGTATIRRSETWATRSPNGPVGGMLPCLEGRGPERGFGPAVGEQRERAAGLDGTTGLLPD